MGEFGRLSFGADPLGFIPAPGTPLNPASEQYHGLGLHAPLFSGQDTRNPKSYLDTMFGGKWFSFDSGLLISSVCDPETGLFFPSFSGSSSGNSTPALAHGLVNTNFSFSSGQRPFVNPPQITFGAWVRPSVIAAVISPNLFSDRTTSNANPFANWALTYAANGSVTAHVSSGTSGTLTSATSATGVITANKWFWVVGSYDGQTVRLYVNGVPKASAALASRVGNAGSTIYIGGNPQEIGGSESVNGMVGDCRVYRYCLSASQIKTFYEDRWGLYRQTYKVAGKAGVVTSVAATSTINLHPASLSAFARSVSAVSTVNLHASPSGIRVGNAAASSTINLSIQTHTSNVPVSASSTINFHPSSNNIQTWTKTASSTINLHPTAAARNTILRVSAVSNLNLAGVESGGNSFHRSISGTINFHASATARSDKIFASASSGFNLTNTARVVGLSFHVDAFSNINFASSSTGGKAYAAGATSTINFHVGAVPNSFPRSRFNLSCTANAFRQVGPAQNTISFSVSAEGSVELPDLGGSINKTYYTGVSKEFPVHYAETPTGLLLIADGIDPVLRWDGLTRTFYPAGIIAPLTALTLASSGSGSLTGTYTAYSRFVDSEGNVSNLSPISNEVDVADALSIDYTNVPLTEEGRVTRRQIIRNTSGQASTYFVDIDTTDLVSTSFSSTLDDATLGTQEAVVLLDTNNNVIANLNAPPPNFKAVPASHLNRMFLAVDVEYKAGNVQVAKGSTQVQGIATEWPSSMIGRNLYVVGSTKAFEVLDVDVTNQILTLDSPYTSATNLYAVYAIRPSVAYRKLVFYSESGLPESWPATNTVSLQEDGDEITGLFTKGSFLYIVERRRIYRFTFQADPATDGFVFLATNRGTLNQRCIVSVEDFTYMMDEWGIHKYDGGETSESISIPIQTLFRPGYGGLAVNWSADTRLWHAAHSPTQDTIRWFVSMSGHREPRHAICYNYRQTRWWIEEYPSKMTGSTVATLGYRRSLVGSDARRILSIDLGTLDSIEQPIGTLAGVVTSVGAASVTVSSASFIAPGIINAPVVISRGKGVEQSRRIVSVSGTTLYLDRPWLVRPDSTSSFQIGGIPFDWKSSWLRYSDDEESNNRSIDLGFEPTQASTYASLELFIDYSATARVWSYTRTQDGVTTTKGQSKIGLNLSQTQGYVVYRYDGHSEQYARGDSVVSMRMTGVQGAEQVIVYQVTANGATQ